MDIIGIFFIIVISAIRFDVGWDYPSYYGFIYPYLDNEELTKIEPICQQILNFANSLDYPPSLFIIFSVLSYGIVGYSLYKYSSNLYIAILVYLAFFYLSSLSIIRQGLAIALIIYAFPCLSDKKYFRYSILSLISFFIHYSSIISVILLPIYLLTNRKLLPLIVAVTFISLFSLKVIVEKVVPGYLNYVVNAQEYKGGSLMLILMIFIAIMIVCFAYKQHNTFLLKCSGIVLIGAIITTFLGGHIGGRIALYFYVPLLYSIPQIYKMIKSVILKQSVIIFLYLIFLVTILIDSNNPIKSGVTPYKTIFTEDVYNPKFKN